MPGTKNMEATGLYHSGKSPTGTDWDRLRAMTDEEIEAGAQSDPDALPTDDEFWKDAKIVLPRRKQVVTMRLDADLLEWLRRDRGYQTRVNAILRSYMNSQKP